MLIQSASADTGPSSQTILPRWKPETHTLKVPTAPEQHMTVSPSHS